MPAIPKFKPVTVTEHRSQAETACNSKFAFGNCQYCRESISSQAPRTEVLPSGMPRVSVRAAKNTGTREKPKTDRRRSTQWFNRLLVLRKKFSTT